MNQEHIEGIKKALEHCGGTHSLQHVVDRLESGDAQYWEEGSAAIITELRETPNMRVLHFWLATGDLEDVILLSERIIEWGRYVGCQRATLAGRKGWEKVLARNGWSPELVLMGRDISNGQGINSDDYADTGIRPGQPTLR